jgi:hypothetical protein
VDALAVSDPVSVRELNVAGPGVIDPIATLFIDPSDVGAIVNSPLGEIVTLPVPVGDKLMALLIPLAVTLPVEVTFKKVPFAGVEVPIAPGAFNTSCTIWFGVALTVTPLCTNGNTSELALTALAAGNCEILTFAIIYYSSLEDSSTAGAGICEDASSWIELISCATF